MRRLFEQKIAEACHELFAIDCVIVLSRPEDQFGDYATNIALQLSRQLARSPRDIGDELAVRLSESLGDDVSSISVEGPGFLNFKLSDRALIKSLDERPAEFLKGKVVVAEYSDPNPFKVLHAGHLYTSIVGDAIANLLQKAGGEVHRVNFGGDVGLHVAKNMWAILNFLGGEKPDKLVEISDTERAQWLSERYIEGNEAYENDQSAKQPIIEINKRVYELHEANDHKSLFAQIYWTCREWSYDYFDKFYDQLGISFERYYPESETAPIGVKAVNDHLGDVYQKSNGAVIFNGEKYGLHTRVFISSAGLPTYEAKDVGLILKKWQDYHFDRSVVITANEIVQYMQVVLKSVEQFDPKLVQATSHLTHGMVKLSGGAKMSSRQGNIIKAIDVLEAAAKANKELSGQDDDRVVNGAVKYAFLKSRMGGDINYDPNESVSLEGNSGPYLQYAHARACSILQKSDPIGELNLPDDVNLEAGERSLVKKLGEYSEAVDNAAKDLMPHHVCTYLYELAQDFNRFYENNRVIDDPRQSIRLKLVSLYADTLKAGLSILGIASPDKM
jgi:arginyl-tRNA synthetase